MRHILYSHTHRDENGLIATPEHIDIKLIIVNHLDDGVRKFQTLFQLIADSIADEFESCTETAADQPRQSSDTFPFDSTCCAAFLIDVRGTSQKTGVFSQSFRR
ncbi:hypothetical protein AVEN_21739-1 [Araneus ventricosus]|uniref:Uncharacterized protein n=1 Tax=Araneus ventricosus TaxID=182803 RepID=A0A4Y2EWG6_ARAVE|nr:hypothetical protein AVEN_21739-1 [Araneus ventricosus]